MLLFFEYGINLSIKYPANLILEMINEKFIQLLPKMNIQSAKYSHEIILKKVIICFKCGKPHEHENRFKKLPLI